jgi:hypothetical protein
MQDGIRPGMQVLDGADYFLNKGDGLGLGQLLVRFE